MEAIILAAGYGTRLDPDRGPKALLPVGGTPLRRILQELEGIEEVYGIHLITNNKFYGDFESWRSGYKGSKPIRLIKDGSTSNENRLGSIGDLNLAINGIEDDILVLVADRLFTEKNLGDFCKFFREKSRFAANIYADLIDPENVRGRGEVLLDSSGEWFVSMREKPENPKSSLASLGFYIYPRDSVRLVGEYLESGRNPDPPGHFLQWYLENGFKVRGFRLKGSCYDLGSGQSLREAERVFGGFG